MWTYLNGELTFTDVEDTVPVEMTDNGWSMLFSSSLEKGEI